MGCDSRIYLPPTTRMRDFADVLSILVGKTPEQYTIDRTTGVFVRVTDGFRFYASDAVPEMAVLDAGGFWHWEPDDAPFPGARLFSCSMQEHRRPVLVALADIFGGMLDFNDCDNITADHVGTLYGKDYRPDATNGADWDDWQRFKLTTKPVADTW